MVFYASVDQCCIYATLELGGQSRIVLTKEELLAGWLPPTQWVLEVVGGNTTLKLLRISMVIIKVLQVPPVILLCVISTLRAENLIALRLRRSRLSRTFGSSSDFGTMAARQTQRENAGDDDISRIETRAA